MGWLGPILGFYLFAFATYFQSYLVPGYHIPFYLVVYIVAWVPTLMVALGLFVLLVLLWYWPASKLLGRGQDFDQSIRTVGISLLPPAIVLWIVLLALTVLNGNDVAAPYRTIVVAVHSVAGLWAAALIVVGATAANKFTILRTTLFASWLVALIVLIGALVVVPSLVGDEP